MAILPGVALQELWQIVGVAETALIGVSAMVVVTALIGMMAMIFSGLNERRREMAIFRAMGARPATILGLLVLEAALMAVVGALLGLGAPLRRARRGPALGRRRLRPLAADRGPERARGFRSCRRRRRRRAREPRCRRFGPTGIRSPMA